MSERFKHTNLDMNDVTKLWQSGEAMMVNPIKGGGMSERLINGYLIGDYLDLETEGKYQCSDGSETWTISVDKLIKAMDAECEARLKAEREIAGRLSKDTIRQIRQEERQIIYDWLQMHLYARPDRPTATMKFKDWIKLHKMLTEGQALRDKEGE